MNNRALTLPKFISSTFAALVLLALPSVSHAALNAYLVLTCNGAQIDGESTMDSIGGDDVSNLIEVYSFGFNVSNSVDSGGTRTGSTRYRPIRILKRVDKASPLLFQALVDNQNCEALIRFYGNDRDTGATIRTYEVLLENARIVGIMPLSPNTFDADLSITPFVESVSIVFQTITVTSITGSTQASDTIGGTL